MAKSAREPFNVLVPHPVQRQIEALAGKRAGYQNVRKLLGVDPCRTDLKAYRLSGPLAPIVCGLHLKRGYRLAFTTQPPLVPSEDPRPQVVVLYVGKREPGHRTETDVWDVLHDLFERASPSPARSVARTTRRQSSAQPSRRAVYPHANALRRRALPAHLLDLAAVER